MGRKSKPKRSIPRPAYVPPHVLDDDELFREMFRHVRTFIDDRTQEQLMQLVPADANLENLLVHREYVFLGLVTALINKHNFMPE